MQGQTDWLPREPEVMGVGFQRPQEEKVSSMDGQS